MKITALMENTSGNERCVGEFGLSFLIEANGRCAMFDAGQSASTVSNAKALGIDLARVDTAVLSHGHYDHANGISAFFAINDQATLYARTGYDGGQYAQRENGEDEYIGVAPELKGNERVKVVGSPLVDLGDGFTIVSYAQCNPIFPIEHFGLFRSGPEGLVPDQFEHEQCLLVTEGNVRMLMTGCTHRGIRNTMHWSKDIAPTHVIGGFHFMKVPPQDSDYLNAAAEDLLSYPAMYYTCHCTGLAQYDYLKEQMGDRLAYIAAGQSIEL